MKCLKPLTRGHLFMVLGVKPMHTLFHTLHWMKHIKMYTNRQEMLSLTSISNHKLNQHIMNE